MVFDVVCDFFVGILSKLSLIRYLLWKSKFSTRSTRSTSEEDRVSLTSPYRLFVGDYSLLLQSSDSRLYDSLDL